MHSFWVSYVCFKEYWIKYILLYSITLFEALKFPCEFGGILVFEIIKKIYAFEFTDNYIFLFLFFLFKYDEVIIKQHSCCSFDKKVVYFWKIFEK